MRLVRSGFFFIFLVLAAALSAPHTAEAEAATEREASIAAVIGAQLDAFLGDDTETAFTFASPNIRALFGTHERFGQMVRDGYPMVWRSESVRLLDLREVSGRLVQRVMVVDQTGRVHLLDYQMVETDSGWKINGVQLVPQAGAGA